MSYETVAIRSHGWQAQIASTYGANPVSLQYHRQDILVPWSEDIRDPFLIGAPLLLPANRTAGGKFVFGGKEYTLPVNDGFRCANLHGDLYHQTFRVTERQEDQLIYPHGVVSLNDSIRRESVEGGECDGNDLSARVSGAEVQRHCKAAGTRLEHEHQQQRLSDEACRKEADNERKRAGEVVGKDAEKFTAESPRPRVQQAAAAEQLVSQFLEE